MGAAIGSMLGFAAGVAVSPLPIVAVILLLATPHGRRTGPAFAVGWMVGLAVLGGIVLAVAGPSDASSSSGPAAWTGWLKLVLGVALLLVSVKQWRGRPSGTVEVVTPRWMARIDGLTGVTSLGLGAVLATINPKNGALTIAAAASIAATGSSGADQVVALVVFIAVSSLGVVAPIAVFFATGDDAVATLESWRHWFLVNNSAIMAVLFFVIGAKLLGDAIGILT